MAIPFAQLMSSAFCEVWEKAKRETPHEPFSMVFTRLGGEPRLTYRERLTAPRYNVYGEHIPQITLVRRNLERLKAGY